VIIGAQGDEVQSGLVVGLVVDVLVLVVVDVPELLVL